MVILLVELAKVFLFGRLEHPMEVCFFLVALGFVLHLLLVPLVLHLLADFLFLSEQLVFFVKFVVLCLKLGLLFDFGLLVIDSPELRIKLLFDIFFGLLLLVVNVVVNFVQDGCLFASQFSLMLPLSILKFLLELQPDLLFLVF